VLVTSSKTTMLGALKVAGLGVHLAVLGGIGICRVGAISRSGGCLGCRKSSAEGSGGKNNQELLHRSPPWSASDCRDEGAVSWDSVV